MQQSTLDVCPLALTQNDNVVQFADVDGTAVICAKLPDDESVRSQLDEIYADHDLSFETCRHASVVESKTGLHDMGEFDDDYDMMYFYS
jgi:hypothetical protein